MKHFKLIVLLLSVTALIAACKKNRNDARPDPEATKNTWQFFTVANSPLPSQQVNAIAIDKKGIKWIGTANGLVRISGDIWTVYNGQNSGLPSPHIQALAVQDNGVVWVGTDKGLARFDGGNWQTFTPANSLLPEGSVMSLAHDRMNGRTWIGTAKGIAEVNATGTWILHDETDGILPLSMTTDAVGALWVGAHDPFSFRGSVKKFQDGNWTSYQLAPMGYPSAFPYAISTDQANEVLIAIAGTAVKAVLRFTGTSFQELVLPNDAMGIRAMAVEQDHVWAGGAAFMRLNGAEPAVIRPPVNINTILTMAVDPQGYKWLGTIDSGLAVYHE